MTTTVVKILGWAHLCEARKDGLRQHAAGSGRRRDHGGHVGEKSRDRASEGKTKAVGVELDDGKMVMGAEIIVSAGVLRSPQLLMHSGVGPTSHLEEHGINKVIDRSEVGQNLHDHTSLYQFWRLKEPEKGLTIGSPNPLFK